jgi:hypothetical protein
VFSVTVSVVPLVGRPACTPSRIASTIRDWKLAVAGIA